MGFDSLNSIYLSDDFPKRKISPQSPGAYPGICMGLATFEFLNDVYIGPPLNQKLFPADPLNMNISLDIGLVFTKFSTSIKNILVEETMSQKFPFRAFRTKDW